MYQRVNDSNHFDNCDSVTNLVLQESIGLLEQEDNLHMLLKGFWETESIEIKGYHMRSRYPNMSSF